MSAPMREQVTEVFEVRSVEAFTPVIRRLGRMRCEQVANETQRSLGHDPLQIRVRAWMSLVQGSPCETAGGSERVDQIMRSRGCVRPHFTPLFPQQCIEPPL